MLRSYQPCRRRVIKGDEFNKTAQAPLPPASAAAASAAGENGACADEPPTPPAGEGAEAGILRPGRAQCSSRRLLSQAAAADEK